MNKESILHINTEEFVYPIARNCLVFKIRVAKEDIVTCKLVYWDREKPQNKKCEILKWTYRDKLFDYFQGTISFNQIARYRKYYFILTDTEGKEGYFTANGFIEYMPEDGFFEYLYANVTDVITTPDWTKGLIYYQIFPERFCNGNVDNDPTDCKSWGTLPDRENYMGGDLEGIISKIPYLEELGIECLYLNPIFFGDFNHKYATTDYYKIDPMFGTSEDFKRLVNACHSVGIKILLDGVFNHTGINFKPFQDVLSKQEESIYKDWFHINHFPMKISHHDYECVGAYKWMPKLNTANPQVREFIIDVMIFWIEKFDIDGWRLDVADEVDPSVWEMARIKIKEKYPDKLLLGETWGYAGKLLRGNQMDSVMNYVFRDSARDYFAKECISVKEFDERLNHMLAYYKDETDMILYNLLDSHDTERFLFLCKGNKKLLKLAVAFQLLFLGSPAIYYGDEIGLTGANDPDCRRCMEWEKNVDMELFHWYKMLIQLRKKYSCIRTGNFQSVISDEKKDIYGFVRSNENENCYVILHKGNNDNVVQCPVFEKENFNESITGELIQVNGIEDTDFFKQDIAEYNGKITLQMSPYSVKIIIHTKTKEEKICKLD